jgi:hypothetical protein
MLDISLTDFRKKRERVELPPPLLLLDLEVDYDITSTQLCGSSLIVHNAILVRIIRICYVTVLTDENAILNNPDLYGCMFNEVERIYKVTDTATESILQSFQEKSEKSHHSPLAHLSYPYSDVDTRPIVEKKVDGLALARPLQTIASSCKSLQ